MACRGGLQGPARPGPPHPDRYNGGVLEEPRYLSAEQFLLTTLIVKLAVMAVLATMLARYRRFRHILIFERRGWVDRLVFTLALAMPLMAGVVSRVLRSARLTSLAVGALSLWPSLSRPVVAALNRPAPHGLSA